MELIGLGIMQAGFWILEHSGSFILVGSCTPEASCSIKSDCFVCHRLGRFRCLCCILLHDPHKGMAGKVGGEHNMK
eukprot:11232323-Ditylum_brightwellii.AAC.2